MASYKHIKVPSVGEKIRVRPDFSLEVPNQPIIPFIEGDGTGVDITPVMIKVVDAAVAKAYAGKRKISWMEMYAGEKSCKVYGENVWLPDETLEIAKEYAVSIKGPLTTPVGGGIRSINVAIRQQLDLYVCLRPVRYFPGVPSPLKEPEKTDMVIFRENAEDIYAGIEWAAGTPEVKKVIDFLIKEMKVTKIRFPASSAIGIKPVSREGSERLIRKAFQYAIDNNRRSVTLVHKGNIQKFTEGAFRDWGYELAVEEFRGQTVTERETWILDNRDRNPNITVEQNAALVEPGLEQATEAFRKSIRDEVKSVLDKIYATHGQGKWKQKLLINDRIADSIFQQVVTRADEYQVIAAPNLNGDYISDACAAQVGGLGMAPGANIGDGYGCFEATHGTAPKYADKDVINPSSVMLSGVMMFEFMGWNEVGKLIETGIERTIGQKRVTYDLERMMEGATKLGTSQFASAIIENMQSQAVAK